MEPKARIKSGLIAVALGLTTTFSPFAAPFSSWENAATAQTMNQPPISAAPQQAPYAGQAMPGAVAQNPAPAPTMTLEQAYALSAQNLYQARKAVASKDLVTAERLAVQVRGMNLVFRENDENPDRIIALVRQAQSISEMQRTGGNTDQYRRHYALFLLQQAGGLLPYGEVDLATQLTQEAQAQNVVFNQADMQVGLEPQTMFRRIEDVRRIRNMNIPASQVAQGQSQPISQKTQQDLNQSLAFLYQARQAMAAGQLDRAETLCRHAMSLQLPEAIYPAGADTPDRVMAEVSLRRQQQPVAAAPAPATAQAVYNPANDQTQNVPVAGTNQDVQLVAMNGQVVDQAMQERQALVQEIARQIMQQISNARTVSQEQRNPQAGLEILDKARLIVEESQLDPTSKASMMRTIDKAVQETVGYLERYEAQFAQDQANQAVWQERQFAADQFRTREDRLKTYFMECNKLIEERRYDEAVMIAKKAKEFAPDEPATQLLLTSTQMVAAQARSMQTKEDKNAGFLAAFHSVDDAAVVDPILHQRGISYPNYKTWEEMTRRRRSSEQILQRRPESELEILRKLEMPVSLQTDRPMPLSQILQHFQMQTGVEVFIDNTALAEVNVTTDMPISFHIMKEVKLKSALNAILEQLDLAYVVKDEMLKITSSRKAKGQMYTHHYYIGDLLMGRNNHNGENPHDMNSAMDRAMKYAVSQNSKNSGAFASNAANAVIDPNILAATGNPNVLAQQFGSGQSGFNGGIPSNSNGFGPAAGATGGGEADFSEIMGLIESVVMPDSWTANGGDGEMTPYYPNLSLVVRQTEEAHQELVDLLNQLRKMNDLQIAVEVRYITLADEFYEKMGLDFQMNFKNNGATDRVQTMISSSGSSNNNSSSNSSSSSSNSSSDSGMSTETIVGGNNVTVGLTGPTNLNGARPFSVDLSIPFNQNNFSLVDPSFGGYQADAGLNFGFALLSDIEAYFFIRATQGDTRSNVLQAPKVTIFNGQTGTVSDTSTSPFVISVVPVVGDFAAAYQPIIVFLNEGQFMTVQGVVSSNRQYVRLTLNPIFSTITKVDTFRFVGEDNATETTESSARGDDSTAASTDERASKTSATRSASGVTVQLPTIATFQVQTTVSVPDGGTILLGGMKRLSEGRTEAGTPILNKIPYLQRLFMNTAIGRDTQSIMMMVTPRIIIQEEEEEYLVGDRQP